MPTLTLSNVEGKYPTQSITVEGDVESANYDKLEQALDILQNDKLRAVVLDNQGAGVKLTAQGVDPTGSYSFSVLELQDVDLEGTNSKWRHAPLDADERAQGLRSKYNNNRQTNAAMNGYMKVHSTEEHVLFADYNKQLRDAYLSGQHSQTPTDFTGQSSNTDRVAGLPHEPTMGDLENYKTAQLMWAFNLGLQHQDKKRDFMPCSVALREAHRLGKEAVCIRLSDSDFSRTDIETFKTCAVPTEYAHYEGGQDKSEVNTLAKRQALRTSFLAGVEDARNARKANCVTQVKSSDRVSDKPSLQDAFERGTSAAKMLQSVAPGATLAVDGSGKLIVTGDSDAQYQKLRSAYEKGLETQWASNNGTVAPRPDALYPDLSAEEREAFKVGVAERRAAEKEKEELRRAEEAEAEENKKDERTLIQKFCAPCIEFKNACCPCKTTSDDGTTLICGTSLGDWTIIVLLFCLYYAYLGMWFWALIEVMFVIQEPQRPH